jgi:hypothetical protein
VRRVGDGIFRIRACQPNEKVCKATVQKAIRFEKSDVLAEAFILGR